MSARRWLIVLLVIALSLGTMTSTMGASPPPATERVEVLIGFEALPDRAVVERLGGEVYREFSIVNAIGAHIPLQAVEALEKNPLVSYVEPDGPVFAVEQIVPWGVDRIFDDQQYSFDTWARSTGLGVEVAIIDTGIKGTHEDLVVAKGINLLEGADPAAWSDDNGHGTHVAGTVAALDNDLGVVGVAPDASLYAVKVLDEVGSGSISTVVAGIEWAVAQGIPVMNMSLGTSSHYETLEQACDAAYVAGHLLISSAGNSGNPPGRGDNVGYPAKYSSVVAVAASRENDTRASFSSTGPAVELIAPGYAILSSWADGGYREASGTSMASPHVAGTAALAWAVQPDLSNVQIREVLQQTAEDLGLSSDYQGFGLARADLAVAKVSGLAPAASGDIAGTVKDTGGMAILGAMVALEATDLHAYTDDSGYYLLDGVPVGGYNLTASAAGYASQTVSVTVEEDLVTTVSFTLEPIPTFVVSGKVTDVTGNSLSEATVTMEQTGQFAVTSADGAYEIVDVQEGTYDITASMDGYVDATEVRLVESDVTVDFALEEIAGDVAPSIVEFTLTDTSNPAWVRVNVGWRVADAGGNLALVESFMTLDGVEVDSKTTSVSGSEASGTHELRYRGVQGVAYEVTLTVTDAAGNSIFATKAFTP